MAQEPRQEYKDTPQGKGVRLSMSAHATQMPRWRPSRRQVIWAVVVGIPLITLVVLIVLGYVYQWEWVGVGEAYRPKPTDQDIRREKTLWDWMQLLIIPVAVAVGTFVLNQAAKRRDDKREEAQKDREEALQHQRAEDATLQAYIEYMSGMLTDPHQPLRRSHLGDSLRVAARAQTMTALGRLHDGERKRSALQFLYEAGLIENLPVISLRGANLKGTDLQGASLERASLQGADLRGANPQWANFKEASLQEVDFRGADFQRANLQRADLRSADLRGGDFQGANLEEAKFEWANLSDADLRYT